MKHTDFWKNFRLGEELSISGAFIYNGLRRFHELRKLDHSDDLFEVFYNLAVGFERLLKIVVVLLEHKDSDDQGTFEKSLITHSHPDLLRRVKKHVEVNFGTQHNDFLTLLARFYKTIRYGRFSLKSVGDFHRERRELCAFLSKHLKVTFSNDPGPFGIFNDDKYRRFLRQIALKISSALYEIVKDRSRELNLYTHELRGDSKSQTVFLGKADISAEEVLWKELLVFFMNTKETSGYLKFLRETSPLDFDPADVGDYLDCFQSDAGKTIVMDQLEHLYDELPNKAERLQRIGVIGAPDVDFSDDDLDEEPDEDFELGPDE
jgi:hypothetical protein